MPGNAAAENVGYFALGQAVPIPFFGTFAYITIEQARFEWRERCAREAVFAHALP